MVLVPRARAFTMPASRSVPCAYRGAVILPLTAVEATKAALITKRREVPRRRRCRREGCEYEKVRFFIGSPARTSRALSLRGGQRSQSRLIRFTSSEAPPRIGISHQSSRPGRLGSRRVPRLVCFSVPPGPSPDPGTETTQSESDAGPDQHNGAGSHEAGDGLPRKAEHFSGVRKAGDAPETPAETLVRKRLVAH